MKHAAVLAVLSTFAATFTASGGFAQNAAQFDPVVYRLEAPSSFSTGCIPPCLCAVQFQDALDGTFVLTLAKVSGNVSEYSVDQVNWILDAGGAEQLVTGSGTYTRTIGFAGISQELVIELSFDNGPSNTYESGIQAEGRAFPAIDIGVTTGDTCLAASFYLEASPVPASEIVDLRVIDPSTYQEGCFPPCHCPIAIAQLRGGLQLVPLFDYGTYALYATVNVNLRTGPDVTGLPRTLRGAGLYTLIQGFAGPIHQLRLNLSLDGSDLELFDSGLLNDGSASFPELHVLLSQNGLYCFDKAIDLHAIPVAVPVGALSKTMSLTPQAR
jgi:hypothetical protein